MGTFAETAIVYYRLSFANQGKQISVFCFRLQQANGSLPFLFAATISVSSIFRLRNSENMKTWTWRHGDMDMRHVEMETNMETWTWRHRLEI